MLIEPVLIIGLGNPGKEYKKTRHNVGFMFLDFLNKYLKFEDFTHEDKFNGMVSISNFENIKMILVKPLTYMNNSGETVVKVKNYYKIDTDNIFVIHDDLDIDFSEYKIQFTKGPRQHNGLLSIENHLGTSNFYKVRIGIEKRGELRNVISGKDYVLSNFSNDETELLEKEVFENIKNDLISQIRLR